MTLGLGLVLLGFELERMLRAVGEIFEPRLADIVLVARVQLDEVIWYLTVYFEEAFPRMHGLQDLISDRYYHDSK